MSDPTNADDPQARLKALEERIAKAKQTEDRKDHAEEHYSQANLAWRMVIELVAGLGIGFGIGIGLDTVFQTKPIFLVLFILLGFAAGVKTMLGSAKEIQTKLQAAEARKNEDETRG